MDGGPSFVGYVEPGGKKDPKVEDSEFSDGYHLSSGKNDHVGA
jgi:hypothetical protein